MLIDPRDLVCPMHLWLAEEQGLSGVALALNIATEFRRTGADRGSDPGEFVFWHRFVCEWLDRPTLERAWRKSAMPLTGKAEKARVPVPTSPIDGSDRPKVLVDTRSASG